MRYSQCVLFATWCFLDAPFHSVFLSSRNGGIIWLCTRSEYAISQRSRCSLHWGVEVTARAVRFAIMGLSSRGRWRLFIRVRADDDECLKKSACAIENICCCCRVLTSKSVSSASLEVQSSDARSWVKYVLVECGKTSLVAKVSLPTFVLRWLRII